MNTTNEYGKYFVPNKIISQIYNNIHMGIRLYMSMPLQCREHVIWCIMTNYADVACETFK